MSNVKLRFAPSPTGYLHIGNIRSALINWVLKHQLGGEFILRFDDTDLERSKAEFAEAIIEDLSWLGVVPDSLQYQSKRLDRYAEVAEELKKKGRLYACYETADELDRKRKRQLGRGIPPLYDRASLELSDEKRSEFEREGRLPHWRFLLKQEPVTFEDLIRGTQTIQTDAMSDPVLIRENHSPLYTFASVVDDVDMGITHIVRGEDHVANSAVQCEIFDALGGKRPIFAHHNLLTSVTGEGLSKRLGALSIRQLRKDGFEPEIVRSLALLIGTSEAVRPVMSWEELFESFEVQKISRAPAKFDPRELELMNAKALHDMDFDHVQPRLDAAGIVLSSDEWDIFRENITKINELSALKNIVSGSVTPIISQEDKEFIALAHDTLPQEPWSQETWSLWTHALKEKTGRKGKALFMPLRQALTGQDHGPDMKHLLPLIGYDTAQQRLNDQG